MGMIGPGHGRRIHAAGPIAARRLSCPGQGLVHSTFPRSINLLHHGRLVTLLEVSEPLHPFAAAVAGGLPRVEAGQGFSLDQTGLRFSGGQSVALPARLSFRTGQTGQTGQTSQTDQTDQTGRTRRPRPAILPDRADLLRGLAAPLVRRSGLAPLLDQAGMVPGLLGGDAGPRFLDAFGAGDEDRALAFGVRLIGLGPGLTPAGDDFLVGLAASLAFLPRPEAARKNRIIVRLARASRDLTTRVSREFLCCAAQGWFSDLVLAVLDALPGPDPGAALQAMRRLVAYGHSSGADCLVGVLAGLDPPARAHCNPKS